jgi:FKBP-type peptidyl-prolyl cis-trans isomerase
MAPHRALSLVLGLTLLAPCLAACSSGSEAPPTTATSEPKQVNAVSPAPTTHPLEVTPPAEPPQAAATALVPPTPSVPPSLPAPPDVAQAPADAQKTASGLASKVLAKGKGKDHPGPTDTVKVNYTGWTKDGKMFDSSVVRGEPLKFPLNGVIKGWTEGLQLMVVGEKRRLWIPGALAYDGAPSMAGAPKGDLVFDVELLEVTPAPKPPPVPADVKAPPASATKTASGLAYRLLKKGTGTQSPKATDRVTVHYSGWTPDGKMFDSSVTRGEPTTFGLNQVIKGWTEGVQLMKVGDSMRFWIPADMAYGEKPKRPGAPAGMLVFDIELIEIK